MSPCARNVMNKIRMLLLLLTIGLFVTNVEIIRLAVVVIPFTVQYVQKELMLMRFFVWLLLLPFSVLWGQASDTLYGCDKCDNMMYSVLSPYF